MLESVPYEARETLCYIAKFTNTINFIKNSLPRQIAYYRLCKLNTGHKQIALLVIY